MSMAIAVTMMTIVVNLIANAFYSMVPLFTGVAASSGVIKMS